MARLIQVEVLAGPDVGETHSLREDTILVGRGSQCQLQIASPHVSRQQCEMIWQGDQLVLENLGTVNHTYLNDRPIERVYVQDGDLITFCDIALRVRIPREGRQKPDPEATVAYQTSSMDSLAGGPLPQPGSDATVVKQGPAPGGQDTHPPGPLGGPPPRPGTPPGGLGTGTFGQQSGQSPAHLGGPPPSAAGMPPHGPPSQHGMPPGMPPQGPPSQYGIPAGMPPQGPPSQLGMPASMPPQGPPSQLGMPAGMPQAPHGMPGAPGMPAGMPQAPHGMPGAPGMPGAAPGGSRPAQAASGVMSAKKKRKKGKGRKGAPSNLPMIRNIVLAGAGIVVLLSFAFALTQPGSGGTEPKTPEPTPEVDDGLAGCVEIQRNSRTDQEIVAEAQRLFGIGSTYLREYQIADENLWTSVDFMRKSKCELALVPPEKWPAFSSEMDRKMSEAEGLLDQEFRSLKLAYVQHKSAGDYDRALEDMERLQRVFPDREDERHQFARKQKKVLSRLMSGKKGGGVFGN